MSDKFLRALAARESGEGGAVCARCGELHGVLVCCTAPCGHLECDTTGCTAPAPTLGEVGESGELRALAARESGEGGAEPVEVRVDWTENMHAPTLGESGKGGDTVPDVVARLAEQIDEMAAVPWVDELVNQTEIAKRLGVTTSAVTNWRKRGMGFPESLGANAWSWGAVKAWQEGREGR